MAERAGATSRALVQTRCQRPRKSVLQIPDRRTNGKAVSRTSAWAHARRNESPLAPVGTSGLPHPTVGEPRQARERRRTTLRPTSPVASTASDIGSGTRTLDDGTANVSCPTSTLPAEFVVLSAVMTR